MRAIGAAAGVVALVGIALAPDTAVADEPYADPAAHGVVGLCDKSGHPVLGGNIHDKPFVWRAVSSTPAPPGYGGAHAKATLLAYQPRPQTPADQWNGDTLTSTSSYTNPSYPMAQATALDFTLADFLSEFPPMVDGQVQLRMYFGSPGSGTLNSAYPATTIKVTGDTWTTVNGARLPCTRGSAASSETITGQSAPGSSPARTAGGAPPSTARPGHPSAPAGQRTASAPASRGRATSNATTPRPVAGPRTSRKSGSALPVALAIVLGVAVVAGGAVGWLRRGLRAS